DPPLVDEKDGFPVVRFKVPLRPGNYTISPQAAIKLFRFIKYNAFDLVNGHSILSMFALLAIHGAKGILGIPTIATNHSLIRDGLKLHTRLLLRYGVYRADLLTGVSSVVARELEEIFGRNDVFVTPNCIRVDEWRNVEPKELEGDPILLLVSRLTERKNPFLAIRVLKELVSRGNSKARLYIAGGGPLKGILEKYAETYGVEDKVFFLGEVERAKVKELMVSADLLLMPSKHEAFGIAALEAMALGTPVVGMRETGLEDFISHEVSGMLAYSEDEFVKYAITLAEDPQLRRKMSIQARRSAERFDCKSTVKIYLNVYRRALDMCTREKRLIVYRLYRMLRLNPVAPGEWCNGRKEEYYSARNYDGIPIIRRRTRRPAIPVPQR
ncbi:MAG: glycosyltransferase family 4 protein, partial [Desulfurococcales archaeon]|nr:glycosyltransferase family 4 protein [Desulfurococcales archaeon]